MGKADVLCVQEARATPELAEQHLQLLRSVELVGPATRTWVAVTCYLVIIMACATSSVASTVGLDMVVNTSLGKVRTMQN